MEDLAKAIGVWFIGFGAVALIAVLLGLPTMILWNWLVPVIFGLPAISFFQALGLNMLAVIFFKS